MKVRIREKRVIKSGVSYCVQVKRGLFWKTIDTTSVLDYAIKIVDDLKRMDKVNNPQGEQVVMSGWMVRSQFKSGISHSLNVYSNRPIYDRDDDLNMIYWRGNEIATIKTDTHLFGDMGLEPRMVKITIEKL